MKYLILIIIAMVLVYVVSLTAFVLAIWLTKAILISVVLYAIYRVVIYKYKKARG